MHKKTYTHSNRNIKKEGFIKMVSIAECNTMTSSVYRGKTPAVRTKMVIKNECKKSTTVKTVSHLFTDIAKKIGQNQLCDDKIDLIKKVLDKSQHQGFDVLFPSRKPETKIQSVIQSLDLNWYEILGKVNNEIPNDEVYFSTVLVNFYYDVNKGYINLYFSYIVKDYENIVTTFADILRNLK